MKTNKRKATINLKSVKEEQRKFKIKHIFPPVNFKFSSAKKHYIALDTIDKISYIYYLSYEYNIDNFHEFIKLFGMKMFILKYVCKIIGACIKMLNHKVKKYISGNLVGSIIYGIDIEGKDNITIINFMEV